jgi:hypothetical protein
VASERLSKNQLRQECQLSCGPAMCTSIPVLAGASTSWQGMQTWVYPTGGDVCGGLCSQEKLGPPSSFLFSRTLVRQTRVEQ